MNKKNINSIIPKGTFAVLAMTILMAQGCTGRKVRYSPPSFASEKTVHFTKVSDELQYLPSDIFVYGDNIIVTGCGKNSLNTLFIYDKTSGKEIRSGLKYGRGPKETIMGQLCVSMVDGRMTYYDLMLDKMLSFRIEDFLKSGAEAITEQNFIVPKWTRFLTETADGKIINLTSKGYLAKDTTTIHRISLSREDGFCSDYDSCPIEDKPLAFTIYNQPKISISPDGTKMAIGTFAGAILETFDISKEIRNIATKYFIEPVISVHSGTYSYVDQSVLGFYDLFTTDDRIFAAYDGKYKWGDIANLPDSKRPLKFTRIAVFDWKGNGLAIYDTGYRVERIFYAETENTLYAMITDKERKYFIGKIKI